MGTALAAIPLAAPVIAPPLPDLPLDVEPIEAALPADVGNTALYILIGVFAMAVILPLAELALSGRREKQIAAKAKRIASRRRR
jgi:hypothetical protein